MSEEYQSWPSEAMAVQYRIADSPMAGRRGGRLCMYVCMFVSILTAKKMLRFPKIPGECKSLIDKNNVWFIAMKYLIRRRENSVTSEKKIKKTQKSKSLKL